MFSDTYGEKDQAFRANNTLRAKWLSGSLHNIRNKRCQFASRQRRYLSPVPPALFISDSAKAVTRGYRHIIEIMFYRMREIKESSRYMDAGVLRVLPPYPADVTHAAKVRVFSFYSAWLASTNLW